MPVKIWWGDAEKNIIRMDYQGTWTLEEFHAMIDTVYDMLMSIDHTVYLVSDFSSSTTPPTRFLSAGRHMSNTSGTTWHRIHFSVMINPGSFLRSMGTLVQKLFLKEAKMVFASSVEEALSLIEKHRHSIQQQG